jgi:tRNA (guanine10-N2)-methyltransferase
MHILSFKIRVCIRTFLESLALDQHLINTDLQPCSQGRVDLAKPATTFSLIEFWGLDHNNLPPAPLQVFFGPQIGEGQRHLVQRFSIKSRKFIGNTTMDPLLAFFMANLCLVDNGKLVLDPFVGTGSLLLAAAKFGGLVHGGDIDFLTLHARSRPSRVGEKIRQRTFVFISLMLANSQIILK